MHESAKQACVLALVSQQTRIGEEVACGLNSVGAKLPVSAGGTEVSCCPFWGRHGPTTTTGVQGLSPVAETAEKGTRAPSA